MVPTKIFLYLLLILISSINSIRLVDNEFYTPSAVNLVRKFNRLSYSEKNKDIMKILQERFNNYILNHKLDKERKECPYEKFKDISEYKKNFSKVDEGTYNVITQEKVSFDRGYQVSFETSVINFSEVDYQKLCYIMALSTDNNVYIGVWGGFSPEFSFHFEDFDLANSFMINFNQIAMYDWSVKGDINNTYYYRGDIS